MLILCTITAMAARRLGLEPYLLLRNDTHEVTDKLEGKTMTVLTIISASI
jgi:hypothetical protein